MSYKLKTIAYIGLLCCFSIAHADTRAKEIVVERVDITHDNGRYSLDADIRYELSEPALEALHKGIGLTLIHTIAVMQPRPLLWDRRIAKEQQRHELSYQALTGQYRLIVGDSVLIQNFPTLGSALVEIGTLRDIAVPLFDRALRKNSEYVGIRAWLDIESLPVPMRLRAYIWPDWHHNSGWYRWRPNQ
ncbi:MAG: DUF4390 domain-containing protein [Gammaproteobacteria bacterium]|nr:DUF4390 domain-containing protein [Gammaproteobacteria bacterium]